MHKVYIGMGGNVASSVGSPAATLAAAVLSLERLGRVTGRSSLFQTEPVGYADQPEFVNAVAELETRLTPMELLRGLQAIETKFGRERLGAITNGPRTLDLDLLLYDDWTLSGPGLEVPHPRLAERAFVLIPLVEMAPHKVVPGKGLTILELAGMLTLAQRRSVRLVVLDEWGG